MEASESGVPMAWRVPKNSRPGDPCALSNWNIGIYATADIQTEPQPVEGHSGIYTAEIGGIKPLEQALPLSVIAERLPAWKWPTYPRSYTTVPGEFESELRKLITSFEDPSPPEIDVELFGEGAATLRLHMVRERNSQLAKQKKEAVLAVAGNLKCEICNFDFELCYGEIGKGFCEVHHLSPISGRSENTPTNLDDLAIVCSNCHKMLHRYGLISIQELKNMLHREI
jgi:hypothetical protein